MNVTFVIPAYLPARAYGGPVTFVSALAERLVEMGHRIGVITSNQVTVGGERVASGEEEIRGVRVRRFATPLRYRWAGLSPSFFLSARRHLAGADLVHVCAYREGLGPAAARAARRLSIPCIWEPMGMVRVVGRSRIKKRVFDSLFGLRHLKLAARVMATSALEKRDLVRAGLEPDRVVVRPNGMRLPPVPPPEAALAVRRRLGAGEDDFLALYLGRINYRKGLELLARAVLAAARHSARPLHLALVGPEEGDGTLERVMAALEDRSHLMTAPGPLYDDDKWAALAAADLFLLATHDGECFGISAAEAMAMGTPVLLGPECGVSEWMNEACGAVLPLDADRWAGAIAEYAAGRRPHHPEEVRAATRPFEIGEVAARQLEIYEEVLAEWG